MKKLITIAIFDNIFDVRFNLFKEMLTEAGIDYLTINENVRTVKPMPFMTPSNVSIEIKVYEDNYEEAFKILQSIN